MNRLEVLLNHFTISTSLTSSQTLAYDPKNVRTLSESEAVKGREKPMFRVNPKHAITKNAMYPPFPTNYNIAIFGMGCFWSSEKTFYKLDGVYSTQVGYMGGYTKNPLYKEVYHNKTNHIEVVRVVYNPNVVSYLTLLQLFWESHNPCQGMRQGEDWGTQYRSAIFYLNDFERMLCEYTKNEYSSLVKMKITTEIIDGNKHKFYYAEDYHQQYFYKNPHLIGDCSMKGVGVACPVPLLRGKKLIEFRKKLKI